MIISALVHTQTNLPKKHLQLHLPKKERQGLQTQITITGHKMNFPHKNQHKKTTKIKKTKTGT